MTPKTLPAVLSLAAAALLSACQQPGVMETSASATATPPPRAATPSAADMAQASARAAQGLAAVPACADGLTARLQDGLSVQLDGPTNDPEVCQQRWNGQAYQYFLGFWGDGRGFNGGAQERAAVRQALLGPVGTNTSYRPSRGRLWGEVTVTHVANPVLTIGGKPRPTVQLRQVRHDAQGRSTVVAESIVWVDQQTGIALQRQSITHLADGRTTQATTLQVQSLDGDG